MMDQMTYGYGGNQRPFAELVGKTLTFVEVSEDMREVRFQLSDGTKYHMLHDQDCCESVYLQDVIGDFESLYGNPIVVAYENTNRDQPKPSEYSESWTWTFYHLATANAHVIMRWLGESNGYYSESVDFYVCG